jgi:hypothetical protein
MHEGLRALRENCAYLRITQFTPALRGGPGQNMMTAPMIPAGNCPEIPDSLFVNSKDAPTAPGFTNRAVSDHFVGVNKMINTGYLKVGGMRNAITR